MNINSIFHSKEAFKMDAEKKLSNYDAVKIFMGAVYDNFGHAKISGLMFHTLLLNKFRQLFWVYIFNQFIRLYMAVNWKMKPPQLRAISQLKLFILCILFFSAPK